jgi:hypothetical protein
MQENILLQQALQFLDEEYPLSAEYQPIIPKNKQDAEIEILKKTVKYEQFFFVVNLLERRIEHPHGLADWLGYPDSQFNVFTYFKIIHPRYAEALNMTAKSSFKTANSDAFDVKFMQQHVVVQVPLLHANQKYILTKRTLYPFQIDKSGKVLAYLNHFVVLKEYKELNALDLRVGNLSKIESVNEKGAIDQNQDELLKESEKPFGFDKKQMAILKLIAQNPDITHAEISETLGLNINSLKKTYNSKILKIAREYFKIDAFTSLKEVALYLKENNVF